MTVDGNSNAQYGAAGLTSANRTHANPVTRVPITWEPAVSHDRHQTRKNELTNKYHQRKICNRYRDEKVAETTRHKHGYESNHREHGGKLEVILVVKLITAHVSIITLSQSEPRQT